jgi:adenylosuccinate synthase
MPSLLEDLEKVQVVYESTFCVRAGRRVCVFWRLCAHVTLITAALPGWKKPTHMCRTFAELPAQAQAYVRRVEQLVGVPIEWIGVGAARCVINVILPRVKKGAGRHRFVFRLTNA